MIAINEKVVPTIKAVDHQRADYRRAITTSSRNRRLNFFIKGNIKLQSPKCQLNLKTSTKFLTNQSQIQTKTQPETTSHPKHIAQTRDNYHISKSIKRKDAKQGKLQKNPIANPTKKKLATKYPLTKKQQTNALLTTQIHLHATQIHGDECNKQNRSSIAARKAIQERSNPLINKISEHNSSIYNGNIYHFLKFFISCCF